MFISTLYAFYKKYNPTLLFVSIFLLATHLAHAQGYIANSTYIGGTSEEPLVQYQVVNGETYMVSMTQSTNYPVTNGSTNKLNFYDFVVTKLDNTGKIVYSTFIGGTGNEDDPQIAVENGEVYIVGNTTSANYPVTNGSTYKGGTDYVATKLDKIGNIVYSTYIGGTSTEGVARIAVQNGELFIAGTTFSNDYPVTNGSVVGSANMHIVVTKITTTGAIGYSSYYGGTSVQFSQDIEVVNGQLYLTAQVASNEWPITNGSIRNGSYDIVSTKFDNNGNILFSTFLGGTDAESYPRIEVNNGDVYIAAASLSNNYPVTNTSTNKGRNDFVVTKFNSAGTIVYSTYIGTSKNDVEVLDFKVENGEAYFVSLVQGTDYPTTNGSVNSGGTDIVLTKFDTNGNVAYATYLGSSSFESSTYLTVLNGEAYVMSGTDGSNFPTTDGSGPSYCKRRR